MKKLLAVLLLLCLGVMPMAMADEIEGQTTDPLVAALLPMFDSIARIFDSEDAQPLEIDNPSYVWGAVYLLAVNWCTEDPRAVMTDVDLSLPADAVLTYAQVMFYGLQSLPAIPEDMAASVAYDAANDAYVFGLSDAGDEYVAIDGILPMDDGSIMVTVGQYAYGDEMDEHIDSLTFVIQENPAGTAPYYYSIVSVGRG